MTNFAELLDKAMTIARKGNEELATSINIENTQGEGMSARTIGRWRRGELNKKGIPHTPKKREYLLDMIAPLGFARQGITGFQTCNQLLRAAGFWELDNNEQQQYFSDLNLTPLSLNNNGSESSANRTEVPISCFAYDNYLTGQSRLIQNEC